MGEKSKRFPLPLSSVLGPRQDKGGESVSVRPREISSQTAILNLVQNRTHLKAKDEKLQQQPVFPAERPLVQAGAKNQAAPVAGAVALAEKLLSQGIRDPLVLQAIRVIPRHLFVASGLYRQAYADTSLPIGYHQTISRPYTVARMIEAIRIDVGADLLGRVLEIGTGCGYQAAVLSQVAKEVYSIERIRPLHELARQNLRSLRIPNLRLHYGDGMLGLPEVAPFDSIVVAAAGLEIPEALLLQLAVGGYVIAPVGTHSQVLQLTKRTGKNGWQSVILEECHFVPLLEGVV